MTTVSGLMALYKRAVDSGDATVLEQALDAGLPEEIRAAFADLVAGEKSRLIKLRTLGLTAGFAEKAALTDRILKRLREGPE